MFKRKQVGVYLKKNLRMLCTGKGLIFPAEAIILPLIISLIFQPGKAFTDFQSTKYACFVLVLVAVWNGLFNSVTSICRERQVINFEYRMKNLSLSSYILARIQAEFLLCLMESVLMTATILCRYTVLQGRFIILDLILITIFLVTLSADMMGVLISSMTKTFGQSKILMSIVLIVQLFFSNFIVNLAGAIKPVVMVSYLTFTRWGSTALIRIASHNLQLIGNADYIEWQIAGSNTYKFNWLQIFKCWGILLILAIVLVLLAALALRNVKGDDR